MRGLLKNFFSTPLSASPLWVLSVWFYISVPVHCALISEQQRGVRPQLSFSEVGLMFLWVTAGVFAVFWWSILKRVLRDYPGRVSLWIWRADRPYSSLGATVLCGYACLLSVEAGVGLLRLNLVLLAVFYWGCIALWLSFRAVVLAKLALPQPIYPWWSGDRLTVTPIKPMYRPPIRRRPPPSPACRERGLGGTG